MVLSLMPAVPLPVKAAYVLTENTDTGTECSHATVDSATAKCSDCGHQHAVSVLDEESSDLGDYLPPGTEAGPTISYYDTLADVVAAYGTDNNYVQGDASTEDVDVESALTGPYTVTICGAAEVGEGCDWSFKSNKSFVIQHGASLTINGAFTLNGALTNNGTITVHGSLTLSDTSIPDNVTGGSDGAELTCVETAYIWYNGIWYVNGGYVLDDMGESYCFALSGITVPTCYTADAGYLLFTPASDSAEAELELHQVTLQTLDGGNTGNIHCVVYDGNLTIRFFGENRLISGDTDDSTRGIFVTGQLTLLSYSYCITSMSKLADILKYLFETYYTRR